MLLVVFLDMLADAQLFWAVSLSTENAAGVTVECATVLVDAATGEPQTEPC